MNPARFDNIASRYSSLRVAIVGDFCLDRYFEIDPSRKERSLETGLEVLNVTGSRAQPGAAGTILNNLAALCVGAIDVVGFCGDDGEGWLLRRALAANRGVNLDCFLTTPQRSTFTYTKPLVLEPGKPPRELNRLDKKNWTPTPAEVEDQLCHAVRALAPRVDAMILMDQVEIANTGVITAALLKSIGDLARARPELFIIADSRRSLADFPPVTFKMNARELANLAGNPGEVSLEAIKVNASRLAARNDRPVFVTLAENGIIGAGPGQAVEHVPALPVRGEIDIVGAGDAVTANLTAALASRATLREAMEASMAAASIVIHQLGTTGTASPGQIKSLL